MASARSTAREATKTATEELDHLRDRVETLMSERVTPAVAGAAGRVEDLAGQASALAKSKYEQASSIARDKTEQAADTVRAQPLTSLLIATGVGFLIGRFLSR